jgi:hypothetical protein
MGFVDYTLAQEDTGFILPAVIPPAPHTVMS